MWPTSVDDIVFMINFLSSEKKKKLPLAPAPKPAFCICLILADGSKEAISSSS